MIKIDITLYKTLKFKNYKILKELYQEFKQQSIKINFKYNSQKYN